MNLPTDTEFDLPSPAQPKTQEVLDDAVNYRDWIFDRVRPHMGSRVLEVGAGRGTLTDCVLERERVLALELDPEFVKVLTQRFGHLSNVEILAGSATDSDLIGQASGKIDSAMSFNVLEHIVDDVEVMRNVLEVLPPGGRFACFVPAFPSIFGSMDRAVGHVRRYTRGDLSAKMAKAGFRVVDIYYMNIVGYFAWFVGGRLFRFDGVGGAGKSVGVYDRCVIPASRILESRWRPPFGQSLVCVGERPA